MIVDVSFPEWQHGVMAARKAKSRRGGARPGAGRKPLFPESADLTIRFQRGTLEALAAVAERRKVSTASLVREAVEHYIARRTR
jgi:hypothetical protein